MRGDVKSFFVPEFFNASVLAQIRYTVKPTCISRDAQTFVLVDPILALSILTWVAGTVIFIDLAIHP